MCSSPKASSSTHSRSTRKSAAMDYQAYAAMMRDASANFERVQAMKEARKPATTEQTAGGE